MKSKLVKLENKEVEVKKLPLGKYADLLKALKQLPTHLHGLSGLTNAEIFPKLPEIIADSLPDVIKILVIATDLKKEDIEEMGLDEATDLFIAVIEVNNYQAIFEKIKKMGAHQKTKIATKTGTGGL